MYPSRTCGALPVLKTCNESARHFTVPREVVLEAADASLVFVRAARYDHSIRDRAWVAPGRSWSVDLAFCRGFELVPVDIL
jgi:hypothetical protein